MTNANQNDVTYYNNINNKLYKAFAELIYNHGPYAYSITMTFVTKQNRRQCESQIQFFIKALNYKLFNRYLIKHKNASVHGVYVFEESSIYSNNAHHLHMLIGSDEFTKNILYEEMEYKINKSCDSIKLNCNNRPAIGERSVGLGYSDNCINYVLKTYKDQHTFDETLITFF